MRIRNLTATLVLAAAVLASCTPAAPAPTTAPPVAPAVGSPGPVMGPSRTPAAELASWYATKRSTGGRATVPVATLARLYIEEGNREGVAGDVAFVQAMLETGWLTFPDHGQVRPEFNNFAGIGAVDGGSAAGPARFPDARTGVRAQIQHLRAYADRTVTCTNFATPTVTPRCKLVTPKGKAPNWHQFGNGVWATDPAYATKIADLYRQLRTHATR